MSINQSINQLHDCQRVPCAEKQPIYPGTKAPPGHLGRLASQSLGRMWLHHNICGNSNKGLTAMPASQPHIKCFKDQSPEKGRLIFTDRLIDIAAVAPTPTQQPATCYCTKHAAQQIHNQSYCMGGFQKRFPEDLWSVGRFVAPKQAQSA
jgi:hypothetical protein